MNYSQYESWLRCFVRWLCEALEQNLIEKANELSETIEIMKERGY